MQVDLDSIYVPVETRLRFETYGDIPSLGQSILRRGQLQDILVRPFTPDEYPEAEGDFDWVLVDGGRRFLALQYVSYKDREAPGLEPNHIGVKVHDEEDPLVALEQEYHANEDRIDFSWKEKLHYIRRIHEGYAKREEDWGVKDTAVIVEMHPNSVYKYLQLINDKQVWESDEVQNADTMRTAVKQATIVRDRLNRERIVRHREKQKKEKKKKSEAPVDREKVAKKKKAIEDRKKKEEEEWQEARELSDDVMDRLANADCRDWLEDQPDNRFDWLHWDPPYGGRQGGGAFGRFKNIDDSYDNAAALLRDTVPELYRTMRDGAWLVLWHHPTFEEEIRFFLQGHERHPEKRICKYCEKEWHPTTLANGCAAGLWTFWVNPYVCFWYKMDRKSDGHEIKRFLVNQYEQFFLACKVGYETDPVLPNDDGSIGNVFPYPMPTTEERRHIMHKPAGLLAQILSIISIRGELGADPSFGSGSIFEAAVKLGRPVVGCELDEEYWLSGMYAYQEALDDREDQMAQIPMTK